MMEITSDEDFEDWIAEYRKEVPAEHDQSYTKADMRNAFYANATESDTD